MWVCIDAFIGKMFSVAWSRGLAWYLMQDSVCTGIWCLECDHVFTSQTQHRSPSAGQLKECSTHQLHVHTPAGDVEQLQ